MEEQDWIPTPEKYQGLIDALAQGIGSAYAAEKIVAHSFHLMCPVTQIIDEAITYYVGMSDKQRTRHDYAPRPACPVSCWLDAPTFDKFIAKATELNMSPEHYAFFCISRYLMINEELTIVTVKTGPKTKTTRLRAKEPNQCERNKSRYE